jgi:hypothetical protein
MRPGTLTVLGLDPGGTTGWCMYRAEIPNQAPHVYNKEEWLHGELGPGEHHLRLLDFLSCMHTDNFIIVCESFEFRQGKQRDNIVLDSKEYIGVVKLYGQSCEATHHGASLPNVVFQTASYGKGFWYPRIPGTKRRDPTKLKTVGLYQTGSTHMNDATSHVLQYLTFRMQREDWLRKLRKA